MSRDGAGNYSLPVAAFVFDTVISETDMNSDLSDIASALTASLCIDGQTVPTADLPMGAFKHTGVGSASARNHYATAGQVQDAAFLWCGSAGGTADAITLTPSPPITAYLLGRSYRFKATASNATTTPTGIVSGVASARTIQKLGSVLAAGDITNGRYYELFDDGTHFQLTPLGTGLSSVVATGVSSIADATNGGLAFSGSTGAVTANIAPGDLTSKGSPVGADLLLIGDSAASNTAKTSTITSVIALVASVASGVVAPYVGRTAPSGYLLCDGSAVSRATYAALYAVMCPSLGTVTVTIATPAVFSLTAHGLSVGERVRFTTSGALPTGLTANTDYFVSNVPGTGTFRVSASLGGADVNTSGSQSGTHTGQYFGYGAGDGSTTFNVPDMRGRLAAGADAMGGTAASRLTLSGSGISAGGLGVAGGTETTTLTTAQLASHSHTQDVNTVLATGSAQLGGACAAISASGRGGTTATNGSGTAHQNTQPTITTNYIIKT